MREKRRFSRKKKNLLQSAIVGLRKLFSLSPFTCWSGIDWLESPPPPGSTDACGDYDLNNGILQRKVLILKCFKLNPKYRGLGAKNSLVPLENHPLETVSSLPSKLF